MKTEIKLLLSFLVIVVVIAGAFSGGLMVGWAMPRGAAASLPFLQNPTIVPSSTSSNSDKNQAIDRDELFKPFWQTWDIIHDQFVDQPVDNLELMRGAIRGMLNALNDQHTSYMDPEEFKQANAPLVGEYEGIGAWVDTTGEYLKIISPMPNSPAEKVGLKPNDLIIAVDDTDMTGIDGNLVLRRVLGPAGSSVKLKILRGNEKPFEVTIQRAKIIVPSVSGKMLENDLAYVQIFTFGEKTTRDLRSTLRELMDKKPKGMIIDLRNNGGGYLNTAIEVVSEFIAEGVVMYEIYGNGNRDTFHALRGGLATKIPLVVLVNGGSASASEITAGAIQDYGRGTLVGVRTFGKGSVQNWLPLNDNQGAVRVTIARWYTPKERQIHNLGLTPDIEVPLTDEDIKAGKDPQLSKAIEILSSLK